MKREAGKYLAGRKGSRRRRMGGVQVQQVEEGGGMVEEGREEVHKQLNGRSRKYALHWICSPPILSLTLHL